MAATVSVLLDGTDTTCRLNTEGLGVDVHPSGRFGLCRSLDTQTQGANIKVRSKTASTRWMRETTAAHGSCCQGVTLRCGHGELTDSFLVLVPWFRPASGWQLEYPHKSADDAVLKMRTRDAATVRRRGSSKLRWNTM